MSKLILHIDDEADIRELLELALTGSGYRVAGASSALDAEKLAAAEWPDLIICDLQLADRDGLALIRSLKAQHPKTPVVLLTGVLIDPRVAQKSLGGIVDCYLSKTTPLQDVLREIERLVGK